MISEEFVLVFGASGGVGKAVVDSFLRKGFVNIIATYHVARPVETSKIQWVQCDVSKLDGLQEVNGLIEKTNKVLRAVVFCIGITSSMKGVVDTSDEEWQSLFYVNTLSFVRAYSAIREVVRRGKSRVLVFGSEATRSLSPGNAPYSATKAALEAIVMTLAKEESRYDVVINVLAPSLIDSPMGARVLELKGITNKSTYLSKLPWGRAISLDEVAAAAVSLVVDPQWQYVSGQVFRFSADI